MTNKYRGNVLLLGVALSYTVIAILQFTTTSLFPMALYVSVAWVSLCFALLELIKTLIQLIQELHGQKLAILQKALYSCNKHIAVLSKHKSLEPELQQFQNYQEKLIQQESEIKKKNGLITRLRKAVRFLTAGQIVFSCVMVAVTLLKTIPNNNCNNKMVGTLSLLSFAVLLFTYYLKSAIEPMTSTETEQYLKLADENEQYYLNLLERVAEKEEASYSTKQCP